MAYLLCDQLPYRTFILLFSELIFLQIIICEFHPSDWCSTNKDNLEPLFEKTWKILLLVYLITLSNYTMLGNSGADRLACLGCDFFSKVTIKIEIFYDVNEASFFIL